MESYAVVDGDLSTIPKKHMPLVKDAIDGLNTTKEIVVDISPDGKVTAYEKDRLVMNFVDEATYTLPMLVGFDKNKKLRMWKIWTLDGTVYKSYGELGGNLITNTRTYKGVNKGNSNATTATEQAKREAERDWVKQLDKSYFPIDAEGEEMMAKVRSEKGAQGGTNANVAAAIRGQKKSKIQKTETKDNGLIPNFESSIRPMHCQVWAEEPKVLKYFDFDQGVYVQPKLDGIRCLAENTPQGIVLLSRHGKQQLWLQHIRRELLKIFHVFPNIILDGEMYAETIHGVADYDEKKKKYTYTPGEPELDEDQKFDVISGAIRPVRNEPHPLEEELSFYIFDIADPTGKLDQDERFEIMRKIFASNVAKECPHIKLVPAKTVYYVEEIVEIHDEYAQEGYEGVVIRARDLCYESDKKSLRMRKHKYFIEEEFPIVDVVVDPGVERDQFRWVCEKTTDDGELVKFTAKPKGTRERRLEYFDNSDEYIGKLLTVRFQQYSHEGVPRFPVGKCIRDYE
jgi:ATP-dependent DNA ligase